MRKIKDQNRGMKAQIETLRAVQNRCDEYEERMEDMKRRLDLLSNIEAILNGSLKNGENGDLRNLSSTDLRAMVGVLRRQLSRTTQQKNAAMQEKHKLDAEYRRLQRELNEARKSRESDRESLDFPATGSAISTMTNSAISATAISAPSTAKGSPALLPLLPPPGSRMRDDVFAVESDTLSPLNLPGGSRTVNLLRNSLKGRWDGFGSRSNMDPAMLRPLDSNLTKYLAGPAAKRRKLAVKSKSFDLARAGKGQARLDAFVTSGAGAGMIFNNDDDDDVIVL